MNIRHLRLALALHLVLLTLTTSARAQKPELIVQAGHSSPVNAFSFSPDGRLLASGSGKTWSFVEVSVVKLWDVASGTELRTFRHIEPVVEVSFSADGRRLAAKGSNGGAHKIKVWDVASGTELPDEKIDSSYLTLTESPDGKTVAEIDEKNIRLRDKSTGRELRSLQSRTSDFQKVLFSPDSSILATGGDRFSIRLWDLRGGVLRTLEGHTDFPIAADFSPDGRVFASGGRDLTVRLWDVMSGREVRKLTGHNAGFVKGIRFSPDGKTLVSFDRKEIKLWDATSGREIMSAPGVYDDEYSAFYSPDGRLLATDAGEGVKLWDTATGKEFQFVPCGNFKQSFSPDGKIFSCQNKEQVRLWDVANAKEIARVSTSAEYLSVIRWAISPDSRAVAVLDKSTPPRLLLLEAATGKPLRTIVDDSFDEGDDFIFAADSKSLIQFYKQEAQVWDIATGQKVRSFDNRYDEAAFRELWAIAPHNFFRWKYSDISPDGIYKVRFGESGEIHLREARTGSEIATLVGIDEKDWLVATSEGFFDGSPASWDRILWRFNNDTFSYAPVETFFGEFYYPGLLQDVVAGKRPAPPDGKELARIDRRQPKVTITPVAGQASATDDNKRTARISIEVEESANKPAQSNHMATSGARDLRLFRNGSLVKAWRGDLFATGAGDGCKQLPADATGQARRAHCEINVPVIAGANDFTAYAFNQANVKSADARLAIRGDESLRRAATLHLLAIGVNRYEDESLNLRYAVADAQGFARELKRQQESLQQFARVEIKLLTNNQATKQNILAAIAELARKAQPEDTVIVYFAGHGTAEQNQFYLIPTDVGRRARGEGDEVRRILSRSVSDRELERAFENVDAAQFLFVIDACNSGQALEAAEKRRGPMNSKGLAQLAYEKGMYVLTAAQSFQAAQEVSKLGHGLLTYVLVEEGLKRGVADAEPKDNSIFLREWLDYATRRVPQVQVEEVERALARGKDIAFADYERGLSVKKRAGQRPRVFYRGDAESKPLIMARPGQRAPSR
jgi:WD40 repeat protein